MRWETAAAWSLQRLQVIKEEIPLRHWWFWQYRPWLRPAQTAFFFCFLFFNVKEKWVSLRAKCNISQLQAKNVQLSLPWIGKKCLTKKVLNHILKVVTNKFNMLPTWNLISGCMYSICIKVCRVTYCCKLNHFKYHSYIVSVNLT